MKRTLCREQVIDTGHFGTVLDSIEAWNPAAVHGLVHVTMISILVPRIVPRDNLAIARRSGATRTEAPLHPGLVVLAPICAARTAKAPELDGPGADAERSYPISGHAGRAPGLRHELLIQDRSRMATDALDTTPERTFRCPVSPSQV